MTRQRNCGLAASLSAAVQEDVPASANDSLAAEGHARRQARQKPAEPEPLTASSAQHSKQLASDIDVSVLASQAMREDDTAAMLRMLRVFCCSLLCGTFCGSMLGHVHALRGNAVHKQVH